MSIVLTNNFPQGRLVEGDTGTENFAESVKKHLAAERRSYDFVYIVPTRRRVRELQRELISDISFGKLPLYTLELLAQEISSFMKIGRRMISPSMQGMIVAKIFAESNFRFFRNTKSRSTPAGIIKKIVDQIDYLRENGIASEDYRQLLTAADDSERQKLEEFLQIYEKYEKRLGEELTDAAGLLTLVNHEITNSPSILRNLAGLWNFDTAANLTFFVEGFYNFKKPELEFLKILSLRKEFSFLIRLDCIDANANLFSTMMGTASELAARGFERAVSRDMTDQIFMKGKGADRNISQGDIREYFAIHLFAEEHPAAKLNLKEKVFVVEVRDKLREIEFVAEKIKEIVTRNSAQKLDDICVASYLPQHYSRLVREVFTKYHIPTNVTDRFTLDSNNVVNAILSFIDIKLSDYERGALLRAITNHALTITDEMDAAEAGSILYHAAAICRFERGLKQFRDTIASRLSFLGRIAREQIDDDGTSETEIHRQIKILTKTRRLLEIIEQKLMWFKAEITPDEFRSAIKSLVGSLMIHENIARMDVSGVSTEVVERDARALSAFFKVLDEVVEMEQKNVGTTHALPLLDTVVENLRAALSLTRYNVRQKHGYGVYVTSLEEIRGLEFDYVFIVGLNEGDLPTRYSPEILLPLFSQKENRERQPYLQRHLFYQSVGSFKEKLFLIFSAQTDDVHLIRSSFVDELVNIIEPSFVHEMETGDGRWKTGLPNIYNVQQLIERHPVSGSRFSVSNYLPPNVPRCIMAEIERYKNNKESEFHGRINEQASIDLLRNSFDERIFSSSQIESLSRCGFQFFVKRVLNIPEVPDIEASLSAVERGAVLHKILFRFYDELSRNDKLKEAVRELPLLLEIGQQVLDELGIEHELFEVEKETMLGNEKVKGTLELFLTKVQSRLFEYGFRPEDFEVGFGMGASNQSFIQPEEDGTSKIRGEKNQEAPAAMIGGVSIRGKIDRIDSIADPGGKLGLTIFDYKTSSAVLGHKDVVGDKISPQLILYLSALSKITHHGDPSGAAFISINRDKLLNSDDGTDLIRFVVQTVDGELRYNPTFGSKAKIAAEKYPETMAELIEQTELFAAEKVSEARGGRFNLTRFARDRVCKFCSYSEACRIALRGEGFQRDDSG